MKKTNTVQNFQIVLNTFFGEEAVNEACKINFLVLLKSIFLSPNDHFL